MLEIVFVIGARRNFCKGPAASPTHPFLLSPSPPLPFFVIGARRNFCKGPAASPTHPFLLSPSPPLFFFVISARRNFCKGRRQAQPIPFSIPFLSFFLFSSPPLCPLALISPPQSGPLNPARGLGRAL